MGKFIDLTGQQFERLKVIERVENSKNGKSQWLCQCNCGKILIVIGNNLRLKRTKSCGCLWKEIRKQTITNKKYNTYDLSGEYGIGYTFKDEEFYFDLEDYDKIKDYCWWKKNKINEEYICAKINGKTIMMHNIVMNCPKSIEIDHIYHRPWDNRKEFLRFATSSQNNMNQNIKKNNTSGITGVKWHSRDEIWEAQIDVNNKRIYLGRFINFEDAVKVRELAEIKYFKEYKYKDE